MKWIYFIVLNQLLRFLSTVWYVKKILSFFVVFLSIVFTGSSIAVEKLKTVRELIEATIDYNRTAPIGEQIRDGTLYNKYHSRIKGAPVEPIREYGNEWIRIGKWYGFFAIINAPRKIETPEKLVVAVKNYNKRVSRPHRIINSDSYDAHNEKIADAPPNPDRYYGAEWKRIGGWSGFFALVFSCKNSFS